MPTFHFNTQTGTNIFQYFLLVINRIKINRHQFTKHTDRPVVADSQCIAILDRLKSTIHVDL